MWLFFAFFLLFFTFLVMEIKSFKGRIINLPILYSVYWFSFLFIAFLLFKNDYIFNIYSFLWIFWGVILFYFGHICFHKIKLPQLIKGLKVRYINFNLILYLIIFCFIFKLFGDLVFLYINKINILDFYSFNVTADILTKIRYGLIPANRSVITSIGNILFYLGILLSGYFYLKIIKNKKYRKIIGILFLIVLISSIITTMGKGPVIYSIEIFLSGLLINFLNFKFKNKNDIKKIIYSSLLVIALVFLSTIIITYLRNGSLDGFSKILKTYGFGSVPAFDYFFTNMRTDELTLGKYTFKAIFDVFNAGLDIKLQGIYFPIEIAGTTTNVFTVFRGIISDFGLIGGLIFQFLSGCLSGVFSNYYLNNKSRVSAAFLAMICVFILEGFVISIGTFLSICLAYFLFLLIQIIFSILNIEFDKKVQEDMIYE